MYITRKIESKIAKYLDAPEILVLIGPRQSGKTTLLKQIQSKLQESIYLTFEDIELLDLFEKDPKAFLFKYQSYKYIFIDEFQYSKQGGKILKYIYDTQPNLKLIISGSSALDLTVKAVKYLVGRVFVLNMYQLDFEEFLQFKSKDLFQLYLSYQRQFNLNISQVVQDQFYPLWEEFVLYGGYPRVVTEADLEIKQEILKNILNTYFLREVRDIIGLADDFKLLKLIQTLANQTGNLINYNSLGDITEYDYATLKKYINILDKTYIANTIRPFYKRKTNELTKSPKVYFYDSGLRNYVLNNFNTLENRLDKGFLAENFVFTQLLKKGIEPQFWRTKNDQEVDFVYQDGVDIVALECKSNFKETEIGSSSILSFINKINPSKLYIVNHKFFGAIKIQAGSKAFGVPYWLI